MQQIYRRTLMPKSDFNKVEKQLIEIALRHGCSPVNLLHVFRTSFPRSTSWWLLLKTIIVYFLSMLCIIHFIILKKSIKTQNINNIVKRFSQLSTSQGSNDCKCHCLIMLPHPFFFLIFYWDSYQVEWRGVQKMIAEIIILKFIYIPNQIWIK